MLKEQLPELSNRYPSWGFGLLFAKKRPKAKRDNPNNLAATKANQGWSLDYLSDDVVVENTTRILNVM